MSPAFSSPKSAAAYAALLLCILLLPVMIGKNLLPPRDQIYMTEPWGGGAFPYLHDQIFREKDDIDIAFMGSSRMWWGIDTVKVQNQLSDKLGRQAVVRALCWNSPGFDPMYFIMQDLLRHRRVRMIVFTDLAYGSGNTAHPWAQSWFRLADNAEALAGLTLRMKLSFYSSSILGMPRNMLGSLRSNLPAIAHDEISWPSFEHIRNPSLQLGSITMNRGLGRPFSRYTPRRRPGATDACVYCEATRANFHFSSAPIWPMQRAFARKIGALAQEHQVRLVFLHLPIYTEGKAPVIDESANWPDFFHCEVTMLGVPPARLYEGMSEDDILRLFWNFEHLNQNGQEYFTSCIAPKLTQIYEDSVQP